MSNKYIEIEELSNEFITEAKTDMIKMEKVISNYTPMVHKVARKMDTSKLAGFDYDDMISIGMDGICTAVNRYNIDKGKFNTYVYSYIKGLILKELRRYTSVKHGDLNHKQLSIEKLNEHGYSFANMITDNTDYEELVLSPISNPKVGWKVVRNSLTEDQFKIIELYYINGLKSGAIAKQIGCSQQAILSRIKTIQRQLNYKFTEEELYGYFGLKMS